MLNKLLSFTHKKEGKKGGKEEGRKEREREREKEKKRKKVKKEKAGRQAGINIFRLSQPYSLCPKYSALPPQHTCRYRQYVYKCVSINIFKNRGRPDLTLRL